MQALMHDQPQPPCDGVEDNSTKERDANDQGAKKKSLRK
jgi:hypothetical protein